MRSLYDIHKKESTENSNDRAFLGACMCSMGPKSAKWSCHGGPILTARCKKTSVRKARRRFYEDKFYYSFLTTSFSRWNSSPPEGMVLERTRSR